LSTEETQPQTIDFLAAERAAAEDQIGAAWQLHVEQVQEQLGRGWRENVGRALAERFDALRCQFDAELEARTAVIAAEEGARAKAAAERVMSERLNQTARRLEQAEDGGGWAGALLDGASAWSVRAILFSIINGELQYEDHRAAEDQNLQPLLNLRIPTSEAPAFATVLETMDTVIAMATANELSPQLVEVLGAHEDKRVCLAPVIVGQSEQKRRVAAILYVESNGEPLDVNVLEVVAALAGMALDCRQAAKRSATQAPAGALMAIAPALHAVAPVEPGPVLEPGTPNWSQLSREDQELHAKAQRFARVRVAEMRLYQAQAVRQGREQARLYMALRGEMERGRAQFKHEFLTIPSMIDYFHQELVRTLANDDDSLLGVEYPGPLV
jgi:hypothetical protein